MDLSNMNHHGTSMSMPAVFKTGTQVTLFFTGWTTNSTLAYLLTLLALFILAFLNRFLAALRFQLQTHSQPRDVSGVPILGPPRARHHRSIPKARLSPLPQYMQIDNDGDTEGQHRNYEIDDECAVISDTSDDPRTPICNCLGPLLRKWTPSAPWSWQRDGGWAVLEGIRAFIGYILMLAVMTFNVGIFCAVLGGIIVGEIVLGRYTQHSAWRDGACHDG